MKILKKIFIIIIIFISFSPICFASDETDFKAQIKKEDGSLFEKIIAECIGGVAQSILDITTRKNCKCWI